MSETGGRSVPFFCPYCGEEDLEPVGSHGAWWCHDCNRRWSLKLVGAGPPPDEVPRDLPAQGDDASPSQALRPPGPPA